MTEVAEEMGVKPSLVSHWERSSFEPEAPHIPVIVKWLGFVPWNCTPYQNTMGESIAAARKLKGWQQYHLAEAAKLGKSTISRLEANELLTSRILKAVEQALGVPFFRFLAPGGWLTEKTAPRQAGGGKH